MAIKETDRPHLLKGENGGNTLRIILGVVGTGERAGLATAHLLAMSADNAMARTVEGQA